MATGTVYLDVDDEITSAAARIRGSEATRVALVVPYGSRLSTSRMNFRLLSREAVVNNRRLSIVAADPATRALAASAGLPVFASVAEYETAGAGDGRPTAGAIGGGAGAAGPAAGLAASETVVKPPIVESESAATDAAEAPPTGRKRSKTAAGAVSNDTQAIEIPPSTGPPATAVAGLAGAAAAGPSGAIGSPGAVSAAPGPAARGPAAATAAPPLSSPSRVTVSPPARGFPSLRGRTLPQVGTPAIVVGAAAILALVVLGVGAYVFLPSVDITITPRSEEIGPISLVVRADPDAVAVDAGQAVVPANRLEIPVEVTNSFTTAGRRVDETPATGEVTFSNLDFTSANTIPAGSIVSTQSGVRFRTNAAVTVDRARLVGLQIVPTEADVGVTAVEPGTAGNVEPNAILTIPADEDPLTLKVRNRAATSGGTHEEFPRIGQADIDAALEALRPQLDEAFAAAVDGGAGAPEGAIVFAETAALGEAALTVDPATLVGQEVETFDLGLRATGTVIAVDDSPVEAIAESRLLANVGATHRLVEGSMDIDRGDPTVTDGEISFPVTARAERVRLLDPVDLLARIEGQTIEAAEISLSEFGDVEIVPWPDWVTTIPGIDSRITLRIAGQDGTPEEAASGEPSAEPSAGTPAPEPASASSGPSAASAEPAGSAP